MSARFASLHSLRRPASVGASAKRTGIDLSPAVAMPDGAFAADAVIELATPAE